MGSRQLQLLCITGGWVHPSFLARTSLVAWARRLPGVRVHTAHSLDAILTMRPERYSALLLYFHASSVSEDAVAALDTYVTEGGGVVAIHSAAASFEDNPAFSALLGGRFLHHKRISSFSIRQTRMRGNFAGGGPTSEHGTGRPAASDALHLAPELPRVDPFTVRDELYVHEYDPDNFVHFVADTADGAEPMVWSRLHGKGRVFYLAVGHRVETLRNPSIRNILRHGIRWAMNE